MLPFTPVPVTQQLLFTLLAGALLGSRLGAVSGLLYLLAAASCPILWPTRAGAHPLTGVLSGYLWSLPAAAYAAGAVVAHRKSEAPALFAIGAASAVAVYNACGVFGLLGGSDPGGMESPARTAAFWIGVQTAQAALAVLIAATASQTLQQRERK